MHLFYGLLHYKKYSRSVIFRRLYFKDNVHEAPIHMPQEKILKIWIKFSHGLKANHCFQSRWLTNQWKYCYSKYI